MPNDATEGQPQAGRRPALTREQVLTAALKIIDEEGAEALTMRRLGQALVLQPHLSRSVAACLPG